MKLDYLRQKKELIPLVLFGASVLMALLILIKVVGFFVFSARAQNLIERAIAQNDTDTKDTEKYFAESKALAEGLKKNNLFAQPPPKQHPVKEVWGILGDEVLIEGKWYKVFKDVVDDFCTYPSAIMKVPVIKMKKQKGFAQHPLTGKMELTVERKLAVCFGRTDVWDFYPY